MGVVYWAPELANHVGEPVQLRYDPQDLAAVVVYHNGKFLYNAQAPVLSGLQISLRDWLAVQAAQRKRVRGEVAAQRAWLDQQRSQQPPLPLAPDEVDNVILRERLAASEAKPGLLLFPSDRPTALLTAGPVRHTARDA